MRALLDVKHQHYFYKKIGGTQHVFIGYHKKKKGMPTKVGILFFKMLQLLQRKKNC
jgi:hypothetical protein